MQRVTVDETMADNTKNCCSNVVRIKEKIMFRNGIGENKRQ